MKQRIIAAVALATLVSTSVLTAGGLAGTFAANRSHACCLGSRGRALNASAVPIQRSSLPSGKQRPCCALHAPVNPAAPSALNRLQTPDRESAGLVVVETTPDRHRKATAGRLIHVLGINPLERSTVLRI